MQPTQRLHELGQSLWLDNITRELIQNGTLQRYIKELSITGLTSNPTIYQHAIESGRYDDAIHAKTVAGRSGEAIFFELATEDLTQAADLFRPVHRETGGVDGWVSLEVSPLLAHDTAHTIEQVRSLHRQAGRPNLFIKIPGTAEGMPKGSPWVRPARPRALTVCRAPPGWKAAAPPSPAAGSRWGPRPCGSRRASPTNASRTARMLLRPSLTIVRKIAP